MLFIQIIGGVFVGTILAWAFLFLLGVVSERIDKKTKEVKDAEV